MTMGEPPPFEFYYDQKWKFFDDIYAPIARQLLDSHMMASKPAGFTSRQPVVPSGNAPPIMIRQAPGTAGHPTVMPGDAGVALFSTAHPNAPNANHAKDIAMDWARTRIVYLDGDPTLTWGALMDAWRIVNDNEPASGLLPVLICGPGHEDIIAGAQRLGIEGVVVPVPILGGDRYWSLRGLGYKVAVSQPK